MDDSPAAGTSTQADGVLRFPAEFGWGTATSAHQTEGHNCANDWWEWETASPTVCAEPSGAACDHYNLYPHDIAMLAGLGLGWYRFSIEWSRIEPAESEWDDDAIEHYRRMLACCHANGIRPAVAFHHFTNPRWVVAAGGWEDPATAWRFARFCERTAIRLGDMIDLAITINEPNMPALLAYEDGVFPPGKRDRGARLRATETFVRAHELARDAIKAHTSAPTGMALAMADWHAVDGGEEPLDAIRALREDVFLDAARNDDYIGVNTYTRHRVGPRGFMAPDDGAELTIMGYEFWPDALAATVRRASAYTGLPVIVTENGIGTDDDDRRIAFIERALIGLHACIRDGIDVSGYHYWSALDNFEWNWGYRPAFGLVAVDRETMRRAPKPSATWFGDVARSNGLCLSSEGRAGT